jgi:hypothetical protein
MLANPAVYSVRFSEQPGVESEGRVRIFGAASRGMDLDVQLLMDMRREQSETVGHYDLQSAVLPERTIRPQNRHALALLKAWMDEPDDLGEAWWEEFEQELREHRLGFRELE